MGCVLVTFLVTLVFDHVLAGLAYPFAAAALMKLVHTGLVKIRPLKKDPGHVRIQQSVILGGMLSVGIAFKLSAKLELRDVLSGGGALGLLALMSIGLEQFYVAREGRAARLAKDEAEKARRLGEDGDLASADEMLQEALLTSEIAFGSHHPQVATVVTYLADVMVGLGQPEAGKLMLKRAVEVHEALPESAQLVTALSRYAEHLRRQGELEEALPFATRAVAVSQRVHGEHVATGHCLLGLARLQTDLGQIQQAYKSCYAGARILEVKQGRNHRDTIRARALIASHCVALGHKTEGQRILTDLIGLRERLVEHGESYDADDLNMLLDLTIAQRDSDPIAAQATYARAVSIFRSTVGPGYERASELLEPLPAYLAEGGPPGLEELYTIMVGGDPYPGRQLLREKGELAKVVDASGWTPLQWACFFGMTDLVSSLLSLGADIEHGKDSDYPALYVAARWGRHRSVADILQKGPDINIVSVDGSRPLHGAVRSGDQLTVDILVSRKARLDVTNVNGWTPLHEAAYLGHRKFVVALISEGADVNAQAEPSLDTPLHAAARGNSWLTTETLILNGARLDLFNADEDIPAELARGLWHERVVTLLDAAAKAKTVKVAS